MATINDPILATGAKVNSDGSMQVFSDGGDGLLSYVAKIYNPRITTAIAASGILWAIRSSATKTLVIRGGYIRLALDTATIAEVSVELVRFNAADPSTGNLQVATKKITSTAAAATILIRGGTAIAGLTMTGAVVDATTSAFLAIPLPFQAGATGDADFSKLSNMEFAPGEGFAIRTVSVAPVGLTMGGYLEFSEK